MKIEQVMRPEEAELMNRVRVYLIQDIPEGQPYSDDAYVASVVLVLRKGDVVRAGDRYKVTVERIENAE